MLYLFGVPAGLYVAVWINTDFERRGREYIKNHKLCYNDNRAAFMRCYYAEGNVSVSKAEKMQHAEDVLEHGKV